MGLDDQFERTDRRSKHTVMYDKQMYKINPSNRIQCYKFSNPKNGLSVSQSSSLMMPYGWPSPYSFHKYNIFYCVCYYPNKVNITILYPIISFPLFFSVTMGVCYSPGFKYRHMCHWQIGFNHETDDGQTWTRCLSCHWNHVTIWLGYQWYYQAVRRSPG